MDSEEGKQENGKELQEHLTSIQEGESSFENDVQRPNQETEKTSESKNQDSTKISDIDSPKTDKTSENENQMANTTENEGQNTPKTPDSESQKTTKTPESMNRSKSAASGELVFEAKRKKKKVSTDPDSYEVTFVVTIAMAIPSTTVKDADDLAENISQGEDDQVNHDVKELMKKRKRTFEAPRAQNYYHLEYYIVPDEDEVLKTDCVTYGVAAKLYMERQDPRVIKTWQEGMITWVAWANSHTLTMNKEMLLKLFTHTLELRVWDTKDKVSSRARFDRPKAFRLPQPKPGESAEDVGGVKSMVLKQSKSFSRLQPKKGPPIRSLPTTITYHKTLTASAKRRQFIEAAEEDAMGMALGDSLKSRRDSPDISILQSDKPRSSNSPLRSSLSPSSTVDPGSPLPDQHQESRTVNRLAPIAATRTTSSATREVRSVKSMAKNRTISQTSTISKAQPSSTSTNANRSRAGLHSSASGAVSTGGQQNATPSPSKHKRNKKAEAAAMEAAEEVRKNGICKVPIQMSLLFSDMKSVTGRLENPVAGVEDIFITVSLDSPLMSDKIKKELNPMIIKIHSASDLPDTPLSYTELKNKCHPAYCKYKFFKQPEHISVGKEHDRTIYWDDTNVVLLGHLEKSELREFLNGPALEIEVHDRDRKNQEIKLKPTLFGDDLEDEKISNVGTVASRRTVHNPFHGRNKPWDPYGVAKVSLSELLLGHRYLHLKIPIHNCQLPDVLGNNYNKNGRIVGVNGAVDGPVETPLPAGHYLHYNSMLKIKIELAVPLATPDDIKAKQHLETTFECPYGRIVYIFSYHNTAILNNLHKIITNINAEALELNNMPQHVINAALSTYKLSLEQQESRELDIVTGFQVMDGTHHIFVLEGLRDRAIKQIWNNVRKEEISDMRILYNSDMSFSHRLYRALDVDICRVKLHESLSIIAQQSLLFVRDMVPKLCFHALVKLQQLSNTEKLRDATRNDLFPTAEMIISMSREFGVPFTAEDFEELRPESQMKKTPPKDLKPISELGTSRNWTPIDQYNHEYITMLAQKEGRQLTIDFIQDNKVSVENQSRRNRKDKERNQRLSIRADVKTAHNYSSQTLNSTDLGKEKLRKALSAYPDKRYTYCQDYHHSMTVVPVNVEELKKMEKEESKSRWQTAGGWIYPGMKPALDNNQHPQQLNNARRLSLSQPWIENILHANELKAPLNRGRYPWDYRGYDLNLYRRPLPYFNPNDPITIHLAGDKLYDETTRNKQEEHDLWRSKIVVSEINPRFHRCLPETEMTEAGFKSSNQLDRLQGLLKDTPDKYSLSKPGLMIKPTPPLNVVLNPLVDSQARLEGKVMEPACPNEHTDYNQGFVSGPFEHRSFKLDRNVIPAFNYNHMKYNRTKGSDFNVYHTEHQVLHHKHIEPLQEGESSNHLFRIPYDPDIHGPLDIPTEFQKVNNAESTMKERSGLLAPINMQVKSTQAESIAV